MLGYGVLGSIRVCIVIWCWIPWFRGSNEPVVVSTSLQGADGNRLCLCTTFELVGGSWQASHPG